MHTAFFQIDPTAAITTRQLTTFNRDTRGKTVNVPRGQRVTVGEVSGTGVITWLWLTFPGWFWQHWAPAEKVSPTILKTLILRIYFDGVASPAVEAPVGDFFGNGLCEVSNYASRYFGTSSGGFFCSFPMPYRSRFRIEIENVDSQIDTYVFANVLYQEMASLPEATPYFHARFRTGFNAGPEPVEIADETGAGKYVGCTLAMQAEEKNYLSFLEAPEHVCIDDDWDRPRIVGTGLEDYFGGGWYFREGPFTGPLHGVASKTTLNSSIAMYRAHEYDAVHFARRFRMSFVNPWDASRLKPFCYSSVAFLYLDRPSGGAAAFPSREQLLCWYRIRDLDHQSMP